MGLVDITRCPEPPVYVKAYENLRSIYGTRVDPHKTDCSWRGFSLNPMKLIRSGHIKQRVSEVWSKYMEYSATPSTTPRSTNSGSSLFIMLQQRRQLPRVFSQICRGQQYRYKTNYAEDNDTTDTGHHASAGEFKPTHHGHHPEPVNESLGVCAMDFRTSPWPDLRS